MPIDEKSTILSHASSGHWLCSVGQVRKEAAKIVSGGSLLAYNIYMKTNKIHAIARAYIRDEDSVLVADNGKNLFLPGGHIKHQESIHTALSRELREEIGLINFELGNFVGMIENIWDYNGKAVHEHCIIFKVISKDLSINREVKSKEDHLKFHWIKFNELIHLNFLPDGLYNLFSRYEKDGLSHFKSLIN